MVKRKDRIGERHGIVTVVSYAGLKTSGKSRRPYWNCVCDCGRHFQVESANLKGMKSCGCQKEENRLEVVTKHGMFGTKIYRLWCSIKNRCNLKNNPSYKWYGGKGIKVCEEWSNDFMSFYKWVIENGYKEGLSIDRIDSNKDYCPENCRFVELEEQQRNKCNNVKFTYQGMTKCIAEWARFFGISDPTLRSRIERVGFERAIAK